MSPLGLYLHIPFCAAICNYCNFNRGLFDQGQKIRYVQALEEDIRRAGVSELQPCADTVFFGGGTPSILEPHEIGRLITRCREAFTLQPGAEITLEANPETVDDHRLRGFRDAGVTRLSFGVQSFRDDELKRLSRLHTAQKARESFAAARRAGFDNISMDLMMWLPGQTVDHWDESVGALIDLEPDHASLYLLELYPNAPLKEEMARSRWSQAPDDDAAEMYLRMLDRLERAGYQQYEISNVARPGKQCRHNIKYWTDQEWLGFGCGAHSTRDAIRWKNVSSTEDYIARIAAGTDIVSERRELSASSRFEEAMFTGLRLTGGVDLASTGGRYGVDVWAQYGDRLEPLIEAGLLEHTDQHLRLTRQGMLLAHEVMTVFV
jgi:oxygen-independent coproporphyrinogen III oxidase